MKVEALMSFFIFKYSLNSKIFNEIYSSCKIPYRPLALSNKMSDFDFSYEASE